MNSAFSPLKSDCGGGSWSPDGDGGGSFSPDGDGWIGPFMMRPKYLSEKQIYSSEKEETVHQHETI